MAAKVVAMVSWPVESHFRPLMLLACRLAREFQGEIQITFFCCHSYCRSAKKYLEQSMTEEWIQVVSMPDPASPEARTGANPQALRQALEASREMEKVVTGWMAEQDYLCIISGLLEWVQDMANKLCIPRIVYNTGSTCSTITRFLLDQLIEKNCVPTKDKIAARGNELIPLPGLNDLRLKDLPFFLYDHDTETLKMIANICGRLQEASIVLLSTFEVLEKEALTGLRSLLPSQCIALEPLMAEPGLSVEDDPEHSMAWLEQQEPGSVVYISFGSIVNISAANLEELFMGLEASGTKFLLVVRPDLVKDGSLDFLKTTSSNGKIVPWAAQLRVLNHPSTRVFISHCGWNSTMEAIWHGVPFIAWPCSAEQNLNAKFIVDLWKLGVAVNQGVREVPGAAVTRSEVEAAVRLTMADAGIRQRALEMKAAMRAASSSGVEQLAVVLRRMRGA